MKLTMAYFGNPILRKKGEKITEINDNIQALVQDMIETLATQGTGIGLAAPQVQHSLALFITKVPIEQPDGKWSEGTLRVFINPKIISVSPEMGIREEGCLSIPGVYGEVVRPLVVRITATDLDGNIFEGEFTGLEGRCILHENDHINGVLFIDRIRGKERKALEKKLQEIKKKYAS